MKEVMVVLSWKKIEKLKIPNCNSVRHGRVTVSYKLLYNGLFLWPIHFGDFVAETPGNIFQLDVLQTTFSAQG